MSWKDQSVKHSFSSESEKETFKCQCPVLCLTLNTSFYVRVLFKIKFTKNAMKIIWKHLFEGKTYVRCDIWGTNSLIYEIWSYCPLNATWSIEVLQSTCTAYLCLCLSWYFCVAYLHERYLPAVSVPGKGDQLENSNQCSLFIFCLSIFVVLT